MCHLIFSGDESMKRNKGSQKRGKEVTPKLECAVKKIPSGSSFRPETWGKGATQVSGGRSFSAKKISTAKNLSN